jgi:hypothetical protein
MLNSSAAFRVVLLGVAASVAAVGAAPSDPVYQALRQATITEAYVVENIVLKRDVGTLTLKSGTIAFTPQTQGRDTVAVFSGEGEFTLTPAFALETNYLKSLTGEESVKETFDRAMLCFTDATGKEIRGQAKTKAEAAKLGDILPISANACARSRSITWKRRCWRTCMAPAGRAFSPPISTAANIASCSSTSSRAAPSRRSVRKR